MFVQIEIDGSCKIPDGEIVEVFSRISDLLMSKGFSGRLAAPTCSECGEQPDAHDHRPYSTPCAADPDVCQIQHHHYRLQRS
jgi:hypothetical protein